MHILTNSKFTNFLILVPKLYEKFEVVANYNSILNYLILFKAPLKQFDK